MEQPNYYAIIPANVRYDSDLTPNAKLLYGEITALCDKNGRCWATNSYFANLYDLSQISISRLIKNLKDKGYIEVEISYIEGTNGIDKRYIQICKEGINKNDNTPINKNVKENNTSINNTSITKEINNNKLLFTKKSFKKPTLDEVKQYCLERKNNINPEKFVDYYESIGWKVGRNTMKDWKAAVRTWEKNSKNKFHQSSESKNIFYEIGKEEGLF